MIPPAELAQMKEAAQKSVKGGWWLAGSRELRLIAEVEELRAALAEADAAIAETGDDMRCSTSAYVNAITRHKARAALGETDHG